MRNENLGHGKPPVENDARRYRTDRAQLRKIQVRLILVMFCTPPAHRLSAGYTCSFILVLVENGVVLNDAPIVRVRRLCTRIEPQEHLNAPLEWIRLHRAIC